VRYVVRAFDPGPRDRELPPKLDVCNVPYVVKAFDLVVKAFDLGPRDPELPPKFDVCHVPYVVNAFDLDGEGFCSFG
jgi:hypothetical protein